jgi:hypothetical protein
MAALVKKVPLNVAQMKPMPKPCGRKTRTAVPKPPDCDAIDHGHSYHQGTQTILLTVDLTDALPRPHMVDQLASTGFQATSVLHQPVS